MPAVRMRRHERRVTPKDTGGCEPPGVELGDLVVGGCAVSRRRSLRASRMESTPGGPGLNTVRR